MSAIDTFGNWTGSCLKVPLQELRKSRYLYCHGRGCVTVTVTDPHHRKILDLQYLRILPDGRENPMEYGTLHYIWRVGEAFTHICMMTRNQWRVLQWWLYFTDSSCEDCDRTPTYMICLVHVNYYVTEAHSVHVNAILFQKMRAITLLKGTVAWDGFFAHWNTCRKGI